MGSEASQPVVADPCAELLRGYVKCMEDHEGQQPAPYEPEFCEEEKNAYVACRSLSKKQQEEGDKTTEKKGDGEAERR